MLRPTIIMTEQQGLNLSSSPQNSQPLESSFGGDLSDAQILDQILNQLFAQLPEPNLSPTQMSEAVTKSTTTPSTAATEANRQGHQVPSQSSSSGNGITGMEDLLPDSAELQRLFEQGMGAVLPNEPPVAVPLSPGSTPKFYFLPDSKPVESTSSKASTDQQTSQFPQDSFDVEAVRRDFPILHQQVHGKPLIWMDNAATSQKPQSVIDTLSQFYEQDNSNVHRGAHTLAVRSTNAYEEAREKIQRFLGASLATEIVFVRGTTEGINLVAQTYGRKHVKAGDEILLTTLEHHSNIVPWQMLAQEKGAVLKVAPISDQGEILLEEYQKLLSDRTRIVALSHVSNVLGTVLPIKTMAAMAHRYGATVVVDGAQSVPHFRTNVQDLGADFYVFSGHKLFGPTGIGALYGKAALLKEMPPWQSGGNMIESVSFEKTTFKDIPAKFEAGTGNLAAAVGLGAAIDYLNQIGFEAAAKHEEALMAYATAAMAAIPGLRQIGTAPGKVSTLSFILKNISTEEMGKFLDSEGIAVRAGHHCAQPTMKRFGVTSTVRPSLAFYNTFGEVDALIAAINKAKHQLS
ncbi:MAG: cysteine desulfurase [Symploca sp. SIO2E6]|nr:cysteine desulfurase [Symploca sp. SIO2E6]